MHSRLAELVDYAQAQRRQLLTAVAMVPEQLRDGRVEPSTWSVAEVLEHLHRVESGIVRLFTRGVQRVKDAGAEAEREAVSFMGSLDAFQLTSRRPATIAPDMVAPRGNISAVEAVVALEQSRRDLLSAVLAGDGLALGSVTYAHPLLGTLNLYQWILFVGQHEARHAQQIQEIARQLTAAADNPQHPE